MKKIALAITLLGALNAHAGDYQDAVAKQKACGKYGEVAQSYFQDKVDGKPYEEYHSPRKNHELLANAMMKAAYESESPKDAHMAAWSICMDNIENFALRDKQGLPADPALIKGR